VLTEVHLTDGGPPTGSVSSVLTESHLTIGRPRAPDMISELSESCRAVKHDRHGNPVPERAISAAAVYPPPSAVVSVLTEHGTGGGNSAAAQRVAPAAVPVPTLYSGYTTADPPVSGVTVGPSPNFGVASGPSPIWSPTRCNGEALANLSPNVFQTSVESPPGPSPANSWKAENRHSALPMDVESWLGIGPADNPAANFQSIVVNQTNVLNEACVFGNVNNQQVVNEARIAVDTTMNFAEERHSTVLNASVFAYQQEVDSARRDARAAHEVNKSLHDTVLRLQQDREADAARATRYRELEQAFELQCNQLLVMQREKENAATAAQAHAAAWSAAQRSDSSGEGNHFHELSSSGTGSQPGGVRNTFGYTKGAHSDQATTCPTAGGHEGSQASFRERELFHIDLTNYNANPELGITPDGRAEHSELSDALASAVAGRPIRPASSPPLSGAELSAPQEAQFAQTQTITAPTVTKRVNRKPSPNRPAGSSQDGNRKPDKGDKDGKKDDDDEGKGDDRGPTKPPRPGIPGGKKDPDGDSPDASPDGSLFDEDEEEIIGPSQQVRARPPRVREAGEIKFLVFPLG
jgi:hypothetical protein